MIIFLIIAGVLALGTLLYMQHPRFGKAATGKRLERMQQSPNFKNGVFENLEKTPDFGEGYGFGSAMYKFFFEKSKEVNPKATIPSVKADLKTLNADSTSIVWFGHSSYLLQINGVKFLVDPVFSDNASPIAGTTKAFKGSNVYTPEDMPEIDYLVITHDHYDHLDYATIKSLQPKVKNVITGLGVGAHMEYWGFNEKNIIELDWNEAASLVNGIKVTALPARHFSGRSFKRNTTLWMSLLVQTADSKILIGGDSGYGNHFAKIGEQYGPIDLAIIENGQYNEAWHYIHCLPEETLKAAKDLKAKALLPVHNSKFPLSIHAWYEPMAEVKRLNQNYNIRLLTPMIGEIVHVQDTAQVYSAWWEPLIK